MSLIPTCPHCDVIGPSRRAVITGLAAVAVAPVRASTFVTQLRQFDRRARAKGAEDWVFCDGSVDCGAKVGLAICE